MSASLAGRSVVITGAGAGVGRAIALECAAHGATVVVAAPNRNGAETVECIVDRGGAAVWSQCDVTVAAEVERAVALAVERTGALDAIIHNATSRFSSEPARLEAVDEQLLDDHVAVSLRGAYHCARAAADALRPGRGRFVLMTSPAGMEGSATLPVYGIVKGALRGFAKSLAREWAAMGATVNLVSPLAQTPAMVKAYEADPNLEARLAARIPLGHVGDAEREIAPAVVFLLGDGAAYITGQTIVVDGGRFMGL